MPKRILNTITQLCLGYLWKGREQSAKRATVSWKAIFYPKFKEGLSLKDMLSWNQVCILQNI